MGRILAILVTAILLQGCSKQLTLQGTVAGSDGSSPKYCMLVHKADGRVYKTTHFVPPHFRRTFSLVRSDKLIVDCAGYIQKEIPISSSSNRNLGMVVLARSAGT